MAETLKTMLDKYQANCNRISEIADSCEKENRERTEAETAEYKALCRENSLLDMKMNVKATEHLRENPDSEKEAITLIRENAQKGVRTELTLIRSTDPANNQGKLMMVADATTGKIIPLKIQDVIEPLIEGFILDKVGLPMPTGLAGDYVWPTYEAVEASVLGEGVALADTEIELSKVVAQPQRIGVAVPVTNQTLNQTEGVMEMIVRKVLPQSLRLLLNKILFSTEKVTNATTLAGPFVGKVASELSAIPTFAELNAMKAKVLGAGVSGENLCWVMTKSMEAILEGVPVNKDGVFVPICQNRMVAGVPVYTTNCIKTGDAEYIGLGDWRYQPMGLFGSIRFTVDPYSRARKDSVDFVLNADYATTTLISDAFVLGEVGAKEEEEEEEDGE